MESRKRIQQTRKHWKEAKLTNSPRTMHGPENLC